MEADSIPKLTQPNEADVDNNHFKSSLRGSAPLDLINFFEDCAFSPEKNSFGQSIQWI